MLTSGLSTIPGSLSTKISGLSTFTRRLSTKISRLSTITRRLSTKISGLSTITRRLSTKISGLSTSPVFFCRISNLTSALPRKNPRFHRDFSAVNIYIVKKENIPHIPHISHVKNFLQTQSYVRDVRDVRDVFLLALYIYTRTRKWAQIAFFLQTAKKKPIFRRNPLWTTVFFNRRGRCVFPDGPASCGRWRAMHRRCMPARRARAG